MICILSLSKKNNLFLDKSLPKINIQKITKEELKNRILNENYNIIQDLGYESLNNTELLCMNQIFHNLNNYQGTLKNCFYWYLLLEKSCKDKNKNNEIKTDINNYIKSNYLNKNSILNYVQDQNKDHWTNIIWKMFERILMNDNKSNIMINKLKLYYQENFKESKISSLKYIFFIVFFIIKQNINWNIPLINKYNIYIQCNANINHLYFEISNNILNKLDKFDKDIYIQKFNNIKNEMLNKEIKVLEKKNEENNNINLNRIIKGNPLKPKYENSDIQDENELINKNKTKNNIIDAKEEKINKKLTYFNNIIVKKNKIKKTIKNMDSGEIRELFINIKKKK